MFLLIISIFNVVVGLFNCFTAKEKLGWIASVCGWSVVIIQIVLYKFY